METLLIFIVINAHDIGIKRREVSHAILLVVHSWFHTFYRFVLFPYFL